MADEIRIKVTAQDQASSVIGGVEQKAKGLGSTLQTVGGIAGGFLAANVVSSGVQAMTGFLNDSIGAARESMEVNAQLEAVLTSTGGAAGVTAKQATELASALEKTSKFEDEAILSGENLLLTFTNIGKDVFPTATQTMVDMSEALGQDMKSSAIQLGKALNDPIEGISALSRVGVSFTEEQKEQIKAMAEAGDVAGAQALILAELNKEFGGSAQAASDAAGAQEVYKDKMNDLQEQIGTKMIPIQDKLNQAKLTLVTVLADKVIPLLEELYTKYWPSVSKAIQDVVAVVEEWWPKLQPIFEFVVDFVKAQIEGMIQQFEGIIKIISGVIQTVDALFHGEWAQAWEGMKQVAEGVLDLLIGTIKRLFGNIPEIILGLASDAYNAAWEFGKRIFQGIQDWIKGLPDLMLQAGKNAAASFLAGLGDLSIAGISINDVGGVIGGLIPGNAAGTPSWRGGLTWVGERGPELANLPGGTSIYSNEESRAMAGGASVHIAHIENFYARDVDDARRSGGDMAYGLRLALSIRGSNA